MARATVTRTHAGWPRRRNCSWNDPASGNLFGDMDIAALLMLLGEKELALGYIDAQSDSRITLAWALLMPTLDPIRCDASFKAKVARLRIKDLSAGKLCT